MILLELFLGFVQVGCFAFGGAYGAIALIREVVGRYGWLTEEELMTMIAVSESTPGPIMVNVATYVGSSQAGLVGALTATFAVVLPSFLVMLGILVFLDRALQNRYVRAVLSGVKPCIAGIVAATGLTMVLGSCFGAGTQGLPELAVTAVLAGAAPVWKKVTGKTLSPVGLILFAAALGIAVFGI